MGIYRHSDKDTERWVYISIVTRRLSDWYAQA